MPDNLEGLRKLGEAVNRFQEHLGTLAEHLLLVYKDLVYIVEGRVVE